MAATVAFKGYAEEAVLHLPGEIGGGDGEFQEQERRASGVVLDAEADSAFAVAEESAGDGGDAAAVDGVGVVGEGVG